MRRRIPGCKLLDSPRAFTLLEIVVVVTVLLTLAGILIPTARNLLIASKVQRILEIVDSTKQACIRFNQDTDSFAIEDSGQPDAASTAIPPVRQLSIAPSALAPIPGWKGLYLRRSLTPGDNPMGGRVAVLNNLTTSPLGGFDLTGAGVLTAGNGNYLLLEGLSQELAEAVDAAIDPVVQGKLPEEWGKCVFESAGASWTVYIYLIGEKL